MNHRNERLRKLKKVSRILFILLTAWLIINFTVLQGFEKEARLPGLILAIVVFPTLLTVEFYIWKTKRKEK